MYGGGGGGLEGEPFLQTCAAKGVQAVEEGERLIEQVGADLGLSELAGAPQSTAWRREPRGGATRMYRLKLESRCAHYTAYNHLTTATTAMSL